jgi:dinuclear metal center YbgI/SA1388 family protein
MPDMHCQEFVDRLDDRLSVEAYASTDASANGLQIGPGEQSVERAAVAVDAAVETIEAAADWGADVLVTHHGISWGGIERVTGRQYGRISAAIDNDVALYTAHLPLDGHQTLGNAAGIADLLELSDREPFGTHGGEYIGQQGRFAEPRDRSAVTTTLSAELATGEQEIRVLDFGPREIQDVAIVTGSGVDWLDEAIAVGADTLITGEGKQNVYHEAKESEINVILGGHYATETFGVASVQELITGWDIETTFIDHPTGL